MRPVHQRLLDIALAALGEAAPIPATPEQIAAAEARLGRPLPPGYRAFLAEVGHTSWSTLLALPPNKSLLTDARVRYAPRARQKPRLGGGCQHSDLCQPADLGTRRASLRDGALLAARNDTEVLSPSDRNH